MSFFGVCVCDLGPGRGYTAQRGYKNFIGVDTYKTLFEEVSGLFPKILMLKQ